MSSPRPRHVPGVPLDVVAALVGARTEGHTPPALVTGVTLDSRVVRPGDLYAALPGYSTHGAGFGAEAREAGAVAVLTDPSGLPVLRDAGVFLPTLVVDHPREVLGDLAAQVYGRPADALTLVGITGTNGKTTTAYLVESGLRHLALTTGLIGTVETRIGTERLPSTRTTPEATDLHAIFALMREAGTEVAVMEVSSHALAQHRVDGAVFDVALFTNLSQDHLDFHPDMEHYFAAKAALFTPQHSGRGVVCVDDAWGRRLAHSATVPVTTLATHPGEVADWHVHGLGWPRFTLHGPGVALSLSCHLPGDFNVTNTAMAAVALLTLGHDPAAVQRAMAQEPVVPGRMERVTATTPTTDDPRCVVDYAHTPDAVDAALRALRPTTPGRLLVVLGAGGDRDRGKRPAMGEAAARWADHVIVTDDNPRTEVPATVRGEVAAGAPRPDIVTDVGGRAAAIAAAVGRAREGGTPHDNTVVVLGKGHETGQDIGGSIHPFDDRDALRAALDGTPYRPEDPA
ncbi:MAG: UDP-N-acetylmuramoyl-L-alanyl-D-glutamate--2,6-diaminopimelate ligase [Actinomycetota bacterium]|nr:UDP-N-acetylmuramoyl-L-alanyl-D-glutamate--2,6-diaminopimelate ligase [Actinomycetota bacterium]